MGNFKLYAAHMVKKIILILISALGREMRIEKLNRNTYPYMVVTVPWPCEEMPGES